MTPDEALWAATLGGARALRRDDVGHLGPARGPTSSCSTRRRTCTWPTGRACRSSRRSGRPAGASSRPRAPRAARRPARRSRSRRRGCARRTRAGRRRRSARSAASTSAKPETIVSGVRRSWRIRRRGSRARPAHARPSPSGRLDVALAQRDRDRVHARRGLELGHRVADVRLDRLAGEHELLGHLLAGQPLGEQVHDLPLALGQRRRALGGAAREQRRAQPRVHVRAALGDGVQRRGQLARRALLERVAARAGVQAADQQLDVAGPGVEHDAALRVGVEQRAGEVDPGLVAEPDVDQREVRRQALDQLAAVARRARRADHLEPLAAEQQLQSLAKGLVIFDENERERHETRPTSRKLRAVQSTTAIPVSASD